MLIRESNVLEYINTAVIPEAVGERLLSRLALFDLEPTIIADLGAGVGRDANALSQQFPNALVMSVDTEFFYLKAGVANKISSNQYFVAADAMRLPFSDNSIDLLFSNLLFPWCPFDILLSEIKRVLKPEGLFLFSLLGPDTLKELTQFWTRTNRFPDMHDIGDSLIAHGFTEPVMDVDYFKLSYSDPQKMLHELKIQNLLEFFEEPIAIDEALDLTFEIIYGSVWLPKVEKNKISNGEVAIPISTIHRNKIS